MDALGFDYIGKRVIEDGVDVKARDDSGASGDEI